jgi:hypothetical protein
VVFYVEEAPRLWHCDTAIILEIIDNLGAEDYDEKQNNFANHARFAD